MAVDDESHCPAPSVPAESRGHTVSATPLPDTAADELIEIFRFYLAAERGLAELMVRRARSNPSHPRREPLFEPSGARPTT